MAKAVYPGTFDPVTNGHLNIVTRASKLFERLIVGVYDAPPKTLLFSTEERVKLLRQSVSTITNVEVRPFSGLVVDFARKTGSTVMVRGLRVGYDFEYEFEMALMNRKLAPDIEMVALMSLLEYQFVSSSRIKEVARLGGDVSGLVPVHVVAALDAKLKAEE